MSEIEKMYKLFNVQPQYKKRVECKEGYSIGQPCGKCPCIDCDMAIFEDVMPPFTAEKQLELLKICFDKYERLEKVRGLKERCIIYHHFGSNNYTEFVNCETWEETIAGLINNLWQNLTEEEKQQVRGILE